MKQAIAEFDAEIQKTEADMVSLRVRLETLRQMRAKLVSDSGQATSREPDDRLGPSKAIKRFLSEAPGQDVEAVVAALDGKVKSKAANKARLIRNTVTNLLKDKIIHKDGMGRLFPSRNGLADEVANP